MAVGGGINNALFGLKNLVVTDYTGLGAYFTLPSIGGLYDTKKKQVKFREGVSERTQAVFNYIFDMFKFGIPIYPDVYEESGGNDISEQVLVGGLATFTSEGKVEGDSIVGALTKVADNIVVNPRKWKIHGYTGFDLKALEHIAYGGFGTQSSVLASFISKFGKDVLNQVFKQTLEYLAEARRPFKFNTRDGETIPCLFKSYTVKTVAENNNFVELDLELQEFRFLSLTQDKEGNQVAAGGVNTAFNPATLGRIGLRTLVL